MCPPGCAVLSAVPSITAILLLIYKSNVSEKAVQAQRAASEAYHAPVPDTSLVPRNYFKGDNVTKIYTQILSVIPLKKKTFNEDQGHQQNS